MNVRVDSERDKMLGSVGLPGKEPNKFVSLSRFAPSLHMDESRASSLLSSNDVEIQTENQWLQRQVRLTSGS